MAKTPEQYAHTEIDRLLDVAGWALHDYKQAQIHAARGVPIREFQLNPGVGNRVGEADYLCYVDARAAGVIEGDEERITLSGVGRPSACKRPSDTLPA